MPSAGSGTWSRTRSSAACGRWFCSARLATAPDGALANAWTGEPTLEQQGRAAFARAMASRVDPVSGAIGPVDDAGVPEWAR
jgi:hypothetical protein